MVLLVIKLALSCSSEHMHMIKTNWELFLADTGKISLMKILPAMEIFTTTGITGMDGNPFRVTKTHC